MPQLAESTLWSVEALDAPSSLSSKLNGGLRRRRIVEQVELQAVRINDALKALQALNRGRAVETHRTRDAGRIGIDRREKGRNAPIRLNRIWLTQVKSPAPEARRIFECNSAAESP
jgi:hypothetical protein